MPESIRYMAEVVEPLTPLQQHYVDVANLALGAGVFGLSLVVFLLAMIAVRLLGSR